MKNVFSYCLASFILLFSATSFAMTLEKLQQQFSLYPVIHADFSQDRYIKGVEKPLHSKGNIIISKDLGLWWNQQAPFVMTLKMNSKRMEQRISGQEPQLITAQAQPQLFQFNSLLTAIFNADKLALEENFTLTLSEGKGQWKLLLEPRKAPLNKIFNNILLTGERYLSQIIINDKQNDKTEILFFNHKTTPLTQDEKNLFN